MIMFTLYRLWRLLFLGSLSLGAISFGRPSTLPLEVADYDPKDVIVRDIAIIGGGASGTYAAVRLQEDFHRSVIVVERKMALGGHTETYHDPSSATTVDIGVIAFHDLPVTRNFFTRFDIPLTKLFFAPRNTTPVDFRTGHHVDIPYIADGVSEALRRYKKHLEQYPTLNEGYVFPSPIPGDLLLPFRTFAQTFNYTSIIPTLWQVSQGYGDLLNLPTLYVMKAFGLAVLSGLNEGFLTTARRNNHEIYERALQCLGNTSNVLLGSTVVSMGRDRPGSYAHAIVATPSGRKLLRVKQFLFTIPPKLNNLSGFDLTEHEKSIFSQFTAQEYCTGLLENVPLGTNVLLSNAVENPSDFHLPQLPTSYNLGPMQVSSILTNVKFCSNVSMTWEQMKAQVIAEAARVVPQSAPQFRVFLNHGPFALQVPADAIAKGFYESLYKLQGHRRSYWTGAAWHTHDSSLLWNFTEPLLQRIQNTFY